MKYDDLGRGLKYNYLFKSAEKQKFPSTVKQEIALRSRQGRFDFPLIGCKNSCSYAPVYSATEPFVEVRDVVA